MATQNISDAISFPQDTGSGTSSNTDPADAWLLGKLASHVEGTYVDQAENPNSLAFENINISTDTADVANGTAYIIDDSTSTASDRDASGNPTFRSNDTLTSPDTSAPTRQPYVVVVPSSITGLSLDTDAVNDVYLSVSVTSQNDVTLHYGNGIATPSEPYINLGSIDTSDGSTTRPNDSPDLTVDQLSASTLGSDIDANDNSLTNLAAVETERIDSSPGYSWEALTVGSGNDRELDTWYQAPLDRDIEFAATTLAVVDATNIQLLIDINTTQDSNLISRPTDDVDTGRRVFTPAFRVPAGQFYRIRATGDTADYSLDYWGELR